MISALSPARKARTANPLDILLLLDDPAPMGCVIRTRIVGVIEAEQSSDGKKWIENDRLIGVATHAHLHGNVKNLKELNPRLLDEMEAFFTQYNQLQGKQFRAKDRSGPKHADKLIEKGRAAFAKAQGDG